MSQDNIKQELILCANNSVIEIKTYLVNIQLGENLLSSIEGVTIPKSYELIGKDILNSVKIIFDGPNLEWILEISEDL
ncbi:MAG: hypothetical protein AB4063_17015 [Crocosphaera sp.]